MKDHHLDYASITIREDNLSQLPDDRDVQSSIPQAVDDTWQREDTGTAAAEAGDRDPQIHDLARLRESIVPNIDNQETERQQTVRNIQEFVQSQLAAPSVHATPVDELSGQRLFAMAFPSLFPQGLADYYKPRQRTMDLCTWARHILRYHDGRFA